MMLVGLVALALALAGGMIDGDRDGVADDLEQRLLAWFAPRFLISADDCASAPAEFAAEAAKPTVVAANGTIYGQAFPAAGGVELHYYHLWSRDCGRRGHRLDVEHVSALLESDGKGGFRARYWYAAAHEDTVCDISHAARAAELNAVDQRPEVWISRGKHASFLRYDLCGAGCGSDRCDRPRPLEAARIVNIGERDAPLNGAVWVRSPAWLLAAKMGTDFPPEVIAAIDGAPAGGVIVATRNGRVQQTVSVGNLSLDKAGEGAGRGAKETSGAVGRSAGAVRRALRRVWSGAGGR